jgi:hypothetical protein
MKWMCHSIHSHLVSFDSSFEYYYADFYFFQKTDANAERETQPSYTQENSIFFLTFFVIFQILYSPALAAKLAISFVSSLIAELFHFGRRFLCVVIQSLNHPHSDIDWRISPILMDFLSSIHSASS